MDVYSDDDADSEEGIHINFDRRRSSEHGNGTAAEANSNSHSSNSNGTRTRSGSNSSTGMSRSNSLQRILASINAEREKVKHRDINLLEGRFTDIPRAHYWTQLFNQYFLDQNGLVEGSKDDMLFYVRRVVCPQKGTTSTKIEVYRKNNSKQPAFEDKTIDWEETVYLNLIMQHFEYTVTCAVCSRTGAKELQILRKFSQKVYASPSRHTMEGKAPKEEITYPNIFFTVDNFEECFSECLARDSELVCVELCARDRMGELQGVIFLGSIRYEALKNVYDSRELMHYNVVTMNNVTAKDVWWTKRYALNKKLVLLMKRVADEWVSGALDFLNELDSGKDGVLMVLDCPLQEMPWEHMQAHICRPGHILQMTRLPSVSVAGGHELLTRKRQSVTALENTFYVLDPDGSLFHTRETFEELFEKKYSWQGIVKRIPSESEMEKAVTDHSLFVYCGHGSGTRYIRVHVLQQTNARACSMLVGCSSGKLRREGRAEASGVLLHHLMAGCRLVVANLWDVTDLDIDRFLLRLLEICQAGNKSENAQPVFIGAAILEAGKACKMPALIGYAPVAYGLPTALKTV